MSLFAEAWPEGRERALDDLARDETGGITRGLRRRAALDDQIPAQCPWELVEVAGWNLRIGFSPYAPEPDVWPPAVATRLNRVLGEDFYEGGWSTDPSSGEIVKREGRPPDPRNLPLAPQGGQWVGLGRASGGGEPGAEQPAIEAGGASTDSEEVFGWDEYTWAIEQAETLRDRNVNALDWDQLISQVERRAREDEDEWRWACSAALESMLMIEHARRDSNVRQSMAGVRCIQRPEMMRTLQRNGGLKPELLSLLGPAWMHGRGEAIGELARNEPGTDADRTRREKALEGLIPMQCPWELVEVLGYSPMSASTPAEPRGDVWPQGVAKRLNRELGQDFYEGGWTADSDSAELLKRDGRPADPRNLPPAPQAESSVDRA